VSEIPRDWRARDRRAIAALAQIARSSIRTTSQRKRSEQRSGYDKTSLREEQLGNVQNLVGGWGRDARGLGAVPAPPWRCGLRDHGAPGGKHLVARERGSLIRGVVRAGRLTHGMFQQCGRRDRLRQHDGAEEDGRPEHGEDAYHTERGVTSISDVAVGPLAVPRSLA
jgi:hypothetical protein